MEKYLLNGTWSMTRADGTQIFAQIPGSVYSFLLHAGIMKDPYYRDQESEALKLIEEDYIFSRVFDLPEGFRNRKHQVIRFEGIDTLADVFLNGVKLGHTDNMHCAWEFSVKELLRDRGNLLQVKTFSPTRFIRDADEQYHLGGSLESMRGFPHLRKAHCMFGWDWGPRLPDQGVWRDTALLAWDDVRIVDVRIQQEHLTKEGIPFGTEDDGGQAARAGDLQVYITVSVTLEDGKTGQEIPLSICLSSPRGEVYCLEEGRRFRVPDPQFWWPNGLGSQPLYTLRVTAGKKTDADTDERTLRIGLRTAGIRRKKDKWGESFAAIVNGRTFFSMGADYIPEDNILSRMNAARTRALLEECRDSHFNMLRVWGGGFYPDDAFFDLCDEMGLFVWQDMMFSCANYRLTPEFTKSITREITQNIRRLRHHPSLLLWCGNNEMEQFALEGAYEGTDETAADYLTQYECLIPEILRREDPDRFYWPSSPSSGGKFDNPRDPDRGDVHFWSVWHEDSPFTAYRDYYFRFLSEFGFQSFPAMETIRSFTLPEDRNMFSYVMEMHQRNTGANGKILRYLSQNYLYPSDFELIVYASQLLQADAVRYGVEHLRQNRGEDRCMGAVYWQLNDIWPVASWSSIDYFQNRKALQYAARRFFAPVLLSCREESMQSQGLTCISEPGERHFSVALNISNETWETVTGNVLWQVRTPLGEIVKEGSCPAHTNPFDTQWFPPVSLDWIDPYYHHFHYELEGSDTGGSVLFVPSKHYRFENPRLQLEADFQHSEITVTSFAYARSVEIYSREGILLLSDNFFDMEPGRRTVRLIDGDISQISVRSVFDISVGVPPASAGGG